MVHKAKRRRLNSTQEINEKDVIVVPSAQKSTRIGWLEPLCPYVDKIDISSKGKEVYGRMSAALERLDQDTDWGKWISRSHFMVFYKKCENCAYIKDVSSNGTYLNGEQLEPNQDKPLKTGDVISLCVPHGLTYMYNVRATNFYPPAIEADFIPTSVSLGSGAYADVILARHRRDPSIKAAIKCVRKPSTCLQKGTKDADIQKEVELLLRLNHPNIVRMLKFVNGDVCAYIVMECANGGEMFTRLVDPKYNSLGFGDHLGRFYAFQLLEAVQYLHKNNICHRDLKLENILLLNDDEYTIAKLGDFGLAKLRSPDQSRMKTFCGTQCYMAPELVAEPIAPYNDKIDIWSMGVLFFTMFVGYPPFSEDYGDMAVSEQIQTCRLKLFPHWNEVSSDTQAAVFSMLRIEASRRPSAENLLTYHWMKCPATEKATDLVKRYETEYST